MRSGFTITTSFRFQ